MSFNMHTFLKILRGRNVLSETQVTAVEEAYALASEPAASLQVGDLYKSTQGVRLLVKLKDKNYALISVKSYRSYVQNVGEMVGPLLTAEGVVNYITDHKYEKICNIDQVLNGGNFLPPLEKKADLEKAEKADLEKAEQFFEPPPPKRGWRRGPFL
jgi:hypothetical protein